jgi:hypothetical protein
MMQMLIRTKPRATALRNLAMQCAVLNSSHDRRGPREAQRPKNSQGEINGILYWPAKEACEIPKRRQI